MSKSTCFSRWSFNQVKQRLLNYSGHIVYIVLFFIGVINTAYRLLEENATVWDIVVQFFFGSTADSFSYLSFLNYGIVFLGIIYFAQLFLQQEFSEIGFYKLIRYRSLMRWFWSWFKKIILAILLFLTIALLITLVVAWLFGFSTEFKVYFYPNSTINEFLFQYFLNGFLQMINYVLLLFIVGWFSRGGINTLFLLGVFMVLMLPEINHYYLPAGLNGLGYIALNGNSLVLSLILSVYIIVEIVLIYLMLNKGDLKINEG